MPKTKEKREPVRIDVKEINNNADALDKKMDKVRRDFIQKSKRSKKSASQMVIR